MKIGQCVSTCKSHFFTPRSQDYLTAQLIIKSGPIFRQAITQVVWAIHLQAKWL